MSAAAAVLAESPVQVPAYLDASLVHEPENAVHNFIHDLRQPLSSIEAIAYYLEMTLPAEQFQARQYMRRLQQLVEDANTILRSAALTEAATARR